MAVVWAFAVWARAAFAQDGPPEMTRSTLAGVYTAGQADEGQPLFESMCLGGCHNAGAHKGLAFEKRWVGHPVYELFQAINERMPDDNPGTIGPDRSLVLVAYLLKLNGLPAGPDPLPSDKVSLQKIKIELPPKDPRAVRGPTTTR